jgi:hypothetical protein
MREDPVGYTTLVDSMSNSIHIYTNFAYPVMSPRDTFSSPPAPREGDLEVSRMIIYVLKSLL